MSDSPTGTSPETNPIPTSPLGRQLALIGVILLVLIGGIFYAKSQGKKESGSDAGGNELNPNQVIVSKAAADAVQLETAKVRLESGSHSISTNGLIHFLPSNTINVSPRLVGKVREVFVNIGDHVRPGQLLADMVSSDAANAVAAARDADEQLKLATVSFQTAKRQLSLGTPEITSAEANLIQANENVSYTKRMLVLAREQNAIGGFTDKPLTDVLSTAKQTDTQLAQDTKDLALAQKQYDRAVKLFGFGVAAKTEVESAEDILGKAKDAVNNDQEQARIAHLSLDREQKAFRSRLYANQSVRQAESAYEQALIQQRAAGTALAIAKAALLHDIKQAEHDYKAALSDSHAAHTALTTYDNPTVDGVVKIICPAFGVISARNVNPGQVVDQTGSTPWQMFSIVNSKTVYLDAQVFELNLAEIKIGQTVLATSDAFPAGQSFTGTISYVSTGLDPATHALSVRANLDNSSGLLKDGMLVAATIELGANANATRKPIVPLTSVVHDGDKDYVFVAKGNEKYQKQEVTMGEQLGEDQVVIRKGLVGSETIVTHGALYLGTGGTDQG